MRRRTFIKRSTPLVVAPLMLNGLNLRLLADPLGLSSGVVTATDRVLVVIQLEGGNDGLNMVIPVDDDAYYRGRPNLGIPKTEALPLDGQPLLRLHPSMAGMQGLFNSGMAAVVENIGYPGMNLSHFTGTEIWNTASGNRKDQFLTTGWIGRYLQREYPDYPDLLPADPPAIEISPATSTIFTVTGASIGMSLTDPQEFYDLVNGGPIVGDDQAPDDRAGREWNYIDSINRQSQIYSQAVRDAADRAANVVLYPAGNDLAASLAIIARLVAGGLGTRIYKVRLGGFDTHSNQTAPHRKLLATLSDAIRAFQDDLVALKVDGRVVGMTYSEFGRRVSENGSGTDHGTAAPHFVFGSMVDGGKIFGGIPGLSDLDEYGNLKHTVDFYCYYSSIFAPLFNLDDAALQAVLPIRTCDRVDLLPLYRAASVADGNGTARGGGIGIAVEPNPAANHTDITLRLARGGNLVVALYDSQGMRLREIYQGNPGAGTIRIPCNLSGIPAGSYTVAANTTAVSVSAKLVVVR